MAKYHRNHHKRGTQQASTNSGVKPLIWITFGLIAAVILLGVLNTMKDNKRETFDKLPDLTGQQVIGAEDAPVTVIEFGDYMCPTCQRWDADIYPQLHQDFVETGKVRYVFINTLFHGASSQLISLASETAYKHSPEYFWDYHRAVLSELAANATVENWLTPDQLIRIAGEHLPDIDLDQFQEDFLNQTELQALVTDMELVEEYEVQRTPTIMVNGIVMRNPMDYKEIKKTIEDELEALGQ